jgi:hydrogenase maturation protease
MSNKGVIIGIGNVLHRDDGIGVKLLKYIDSQYRFPDNVELVDGGTCGATLNTTVFGQDWVIVLDALNVPGTPGDVRVLAGASFINRPAQIKMSPHQVGFLDLIQLMRMEGTGPASVDLIGVVPADLSDGMSISPEVEAAIAPAVDRLLELLAGKGITPVLRTPPLSPDYWWLA